LNLDESIIAESLIDAGWVRFFTSCRVGYWEDEMYLRLSEVLAGMRVILSGVISRAARVETRISSGAR
jgi:hypothetical protein